MIFVPQNETAAKFRAAVFFSKGWI